GEMLRDDDDPQVLHRRLLAYRDQTAPRATYYHLQSVLRSVDGMASIPQVGSAIDQVLRGAASKKPPAERSRQKAAKTPAGKPAKGRASRAGSTASAQKTARKPSQINAKTNKLGRNNRTDYNPPTNKTRPQAA